MEWPNTETRKQVEDQIKKKRTAFIRSFRPDLVDEYVKKYTLLFKGDLNVPAITPEEIQMASRIIGDAENSIFSNEIFGTIGYVLRNATPLAALNLLDTQALGEQGDVSKYLGKNVLITPPKAYNEMSSEEKAAFEKIEIERTTETGDIERIKPLDNPLFKKWSVAPEAEILAIKKTGNQPIALAYVFPTVIDSFSDLRSANKEAARWSRIIVPTLSWSGPVIEIATPKISDLFYESKSDGSLTYSKDWTFFPKLDLEQFKSAFVSDLKALQGQDESAIYSNTRLVLLDLRSVLPPDFVYTRGAREKAADFKCPATSIGEKINLAFFTDLGEGDDADAISTACKLSVADSIAVNLTVAAAQVAGSFIPPILAGIGAAALSELGPAGSALGLALGEASGQLVSAFITAYTAAVSQLVPLAYATAFFYKRGKTEIAAMLLTRLTIQIMIMFLQILAGNPIVVKLLPKGLLAKIAGKVIAKEFAINIAGVLIDVVLSFKSDAMIAPGGWEKLKAEMKTLLGGELSALEIKELQLLEQNLASRVTQDMLGINKLFDTFDQMRLSSQN